MAFRCNLVSTNHKSVNIYTSKVGSASVVHYYNMSTFQRILKHSRFGRISIKCYYDAPEQRLTVEILHAADLIALDANGESDPGLTFTHTRFDLHN